MKQKTPNLIDKLLLGLDDSIKTSKDLIQYYAIDESQVHVGLTPCRVQNNNRESLV